MRTLHQQFDMPILYNSLARVITNTKHIRQSEIAYHRIIREETLLPIYYMLIAYLIKYIARGNLSQREDFTARSKTQWQTNQALKPHLNQVETLSHLVDTSQSSNEHLNDSRRELHTQ